MEYKWNTYDGCFLLLRLVVLILVLMEYKWNFYWLLNLAKDCCLNPCFNGIWSRRLTLRRKQTLQ